MKTTYSWKVKTLPPPNRKLIKKVLERAAALSGLDTSKDWTASLMFVGDEAMSGINRNFLQHEGTTDVITFSYFEDGDVEPGSAGVDLVVCGDVACREGASRKDSSYAEEMTLYIVHGFLHASGEDDLEPSSGKRMRRREKEVMAALRREFSLEEIFPSS
jgi:probable rRNA maturation factor